MIVVADRIKEYTQSAGVSIFALQGSEGAFLTFNSVCSIGDEVYYCAVERTGNSWEVGRATYTSVNVLTRTECLTSSNSNSFVSFGPEIKDVFLTSPAVVVRAITEIQPNTILGRTTGSGIPQQLTPAQISSLLISIQANNRINTGTDGKLFVPELTLDLVAIYNNAKI